MPHPDVPAEQAHVDAAYLEAAQILARARAFADREDLGASAVDGKILRRQFAERVFDLEAAIRGVLCFGRIDEGEDSLHIGRTHIEDDDGQHLVIDWRARAAIPFYRATWAEPLGLDRRRRFILDGRHLVDLMEEDFSDPETVVTSGGVPDPLLAELGRSRTGQMRDIASTIQAEQDAVIRAPIDRCLIVQGGPGTGKTAVGLHRAAFLLFEHRERMLKEGVLVVGPNRLFLDYIAQVLPTLGERSVRQETIESLLIRYRVRGFDSPAVAHTKGDARMADVIRRAAEDFITPPSEDLKLPYGRGVAKVRKDVVEGLLRDSVDSPAPWAARRLRFRGRVLRSAFESLPDDVRLILDPDDFEREVLAGEGKRSLDRCWRTTTAVNLVRRILTSPNALERASEGILSVAEREALLRKRPAKGEADPWTYHDLPLLDEADALVSGETQRFGHVVVDEAQDRTPMELRALGRRARLGSLTILGDLAQATAIGGAANWNDVAGALAPPSPAELVELTIGYRLPGSLLDFANRLLAIAAPRVTPARSARETGDPPAIDRCAKEDLDEEVAALCQAFSQRYSTTAVVAPASHIERIGRLLEGRDINYVTTGGASLEGRVAVLTAPEAKGLEFDAVVVVEPAEIVASEAGSERALFVGLTRAVQHLSIVHSEPLPRVLTDP